MTTTATPDLLHKLSQMLSSPRCYANLSQRGSTNIILGTAQFAALSQELCWKSLIKWLLLTKQMEDPRQNLAWPIENLTGNKAVCLKK